MKKIFALALAALVAATGVASAGLLIPPKAYGRLSVRFIKLPWPLLFLAFLVAAQLVIQFRSGDIQPFIYYQF